MNRIISLLVLILFILAGINFYYNRLPNYQISGYTNAIEDYDFRLNRLNTVGKLTSYVDSVYGSSEIKAKDTLLYAETMAKIIRLRFYHGATIYSWKQNWVLSLLKHFHAHAMHIVLPDDILKYSQAMCSQQTIVALEILNKRKFSYRSIGFYDSTSGSGHFAFEIKINGKWHFFDTNLEPDFNELHQLSRPSIIEISKNQEIFDRIYLSNVPLTLISNNFIYADSSIPTANRMRFIHVLSFLVAYTAWFWLGFIYIMYQKWQKKNSY
jgi:hypothetical protein